LILQVGLVVGGVVVGKKMSAVEGGFGTSVNGLSGLSPSLLVVNPNGITQSRASIATFILLSAVWLARTCLPAATTPLLHDTVMATDSLNKTRAPAGQPEASPPKGRLN
jgi:hypothetical protein